MPLTLLVTASHTFPVGQPVTLAALRKAALPSISLSGSVAGGDLVAGAVTPDKSTPGAYWYGAGVLTADTYAVTLTPALTALANGVKVRFRADVANPAGGTQLNVNGLGAKPIYKQKGLVLLGGDIRANQECELSYDATAAAWQLQSHVANHWDRYGTCTGAANAYVLTHNGTSSGQQTVVSLLSIHGVPLRFKASFTNTDAATLAVDGLAAKAIRMWDDQALPNGYIKLNQMVEVVYDSVLDHFLIPNAAKDTALVAGVRNLVAGNTVGTENSKITLSADEVVVKDAAGVAQVLSAAAVTIDIGAAGANGLDTGAEAASTWYYVWLIWNGTAAAGLLSTSATAPTMPAGYTHKGLVGVVRNDAGSNFRRFWQTDRKLNMAVTNVFTAKLPGAADTFEVLGGADLTAFKTVVAPIAKECWGQMGSVNNTRFGALQVAACKDDGTVDLANAVGGTIIETGVTGNAWQGFDNAGAFTCPVRGGSANYNLQWKGYTIAAGLAWARLDVTGFAI